jgi:hypothetical protein
MDYWRALHTLPNLSIVEGDFRKRKVRAKMVTPPPNSMEVFKTEEKGSDVDLETHLLMDVFLGHYEAAIVITGDSDLVTPIRMVRSHLCEAEYLVRWKSEEGTFDAESRIL